MHLALITSLIILAFSSINCARASGDFGVGVGDDTAEELLDAGLRPLAPAGAPGFVVGIARGMQTLFLRGYGIADRKTGIGIDGGTRFELASVTKQITATALLALHEEGRLGYDDPITRFLPELAPVGRGITIRNLLQHTGGYPEYFHLCVNGKRITNEDVLAFARSAKLEFEPGTKYDYSNTGYALLALIIGRASGESYGAYLSRRLFAPAGMSHSFVNAVALPTGDDVAQSYSGAPDYLPQDGPYIEACNTVHGDGSVFASGEDMLAWHRALDAAKLVRPATLAEAFVPGTLKNGDTFDYGFGWRMGTVVGLKASTHSGAWAGYRNDSTRFENGYRVIVLSNYATSPRAKILDKVKALYLGSGGTE